MRVRILFLLLFLPLPLTAAAPIVKSGDSLPDKGGQIKILYVPVINNQGAIAFVSTLEGEGIHPKNNYALLSFHKGDLKLIAKAGNLIPEGEGTFASLPADSLGPFRGAPRLNDSGEIAFLGAYDPDGNKLYASKVGIFTPTQKIVKDGDSAPQSPNQKFFFDPDMTNPPILSQENSIVFSAPLAGDSIEERQSGLYLSKSGQLKKIVLRGEPVPEGNAKFDTPSLEDWLGFGPPAINKNGTLVFCARQKLIDSSQLNRYDSGFREVLYLYSAGKLKRMAGSEDILPYTHGNLEYLYTVKFSPDINASNKVAFQGTGGGEELIFTTDAGKLEIVAKTGENALGNGIFSQLRWQPSLNDLGNILFAGKLREGTLSNSDAIFLRTNGSLRPIVKRGDSTPEGDGTFYELTTSDKYLQVNANRLNLNELGHFAFMASLLKQDGSTNLGLYTYDGTKIKKIVRTGDILMDKKVKDIGFNTVESSGVRGFNDSCQITFVTQFEDDTYALWITDGCD